jgi:hypothetical protein
MDSQMFHLCYLGQMSHGMIIVDDFDCRGVMVVVIMIGDDDDDDD